MSKQSIKKITLSRLVQVFIIAILITIAIIALTYRSFFKSTVENKALSVAQVVKAGLTSHMKAGIMDKRSYFLDEITAVHDIDHIHIIRSENVEKQYGKSTLLSTQVKQNFQHIVDIKTPVYDWDDFNGRVRATIPYIASNKGSLNCLACHNVKSGEVLGVVTIEMNIASYQDLVLEYSYIISGVLFVLAFLIVLNMFHVIERYIRRQLSNIVNDGQTAYESHRDIDFDGYESHELEDVVKNINDFNHEVLQKEEDLEAKNRELERLNDEIDKTLQETLMAMGEMEEIRSRDTKNHSKRVSILSSKIAKTYGLSEEDVKLIKMASPLHDIGKVGIPDAVLLKPGKLTDTEFETMKEHAKLGFNTLRHSKRPVLVAAAQIAHFHHEKYDGSGYPKGLKGEEIPIFARIVAIVDVLDALLCKRVYKEAWNIESVRELLIKERGKHFDPELTDIVLKELDDYTKFIHELSCT